MAALSGSGYGRTCVRSQRDDGLNAASIATTQACEPFSAVTSISIFMRGSARPAEIIMAAGRTSPKTLRSTGQHCWNPAPSE